FHVTGVQTCALPILASTSGNMAARCIRSPWWRGYPPPRSWSAFAMAAKLRSQYVCGDCGAVHAQWLGQCTTCKQWNTLVEEVRDRVEERRGTPANLRNRDQRPVAIADISAEGGPRILL